MKTLIIIAIIISIVVGIAFTVFLIPSMEQQNHQDIDEEEREKIAWQLLQKTYLEQECREQYMGQHEGLQDCYDRIDEEQRLNPPIKPQESETCSIQCLIYDPVCGQDGITYSCGVEDAACHGIEVEHFGECNSSSETKILYVNSKLEDCVGVSPQQCMLIKENQDAEWEMFYDNIHGFDYQEGIQYKLHVMISQIENPPADGSSLKYELIEILEPQN
ncbi:proteinase inhibitor I1 Kazal [Nitrosopumilus cobalaminigenes]|uniref:Proteinase inhibitor I1 Kazal n=1 Tax=Nitrosopumilus cobalaminigenes TaxID=1470066 RepID=A0A7D5LYS3_9ARCH|nr:DUF4377 domain-containing protein [Nitrosopumilus cobalaminigenes]QLH02286.1 proteinase inhibitor I1 Kazal [Nitrosopumilus cobalaminigenes]